jgi:hypothetical protein
MTAYTTQSRPTGAAPHLITNRSKEGLTWLEGAQSATAYTGRLTLRVFELEDRRRAYTITGPGGLHLVGRTSDWNETEARDAATAEARWLRGQGRRPAHTMTMERF